MSLMLYAIGNIIRENNYFKCHWDNTLHHLGIHYKKRNAKKFHSEILQLVLIFHCYLENYCCILKDKENK